MNASLDIWVQKNGERVNAQLRGVQVLNVNDLANAVKPVVLPGENLSVQIIKEGKERNQGVGYLDDGTMIVVDNARDLLGERLDVLVTSVIQTNAGKMIFASPDEDEEETRPRVVRRGWPCSSRSPLPCSRWGHRRRRGRPRRARTGSSSSSTAAATASTSTSSRSTRTC